MSFDTWLTFCILELVLCLTPGPAVLFVCGNTLRHGGAGGLQATAGIVAGNTLYFLLSATGIAAIVIASGKLFLALTLGGCAYLVYLGLDMLLANEARETENNAPQAAPRDRKLLLEGFLVQTANPKAIAFFLALLPPFIDPARPLLTQVAIMAISSQTIEFLVMCAYIWIVLRTHHLVGQRGAGLLRKLAGLCLIITGLRLVLI